MSVGTAPTTLLHTLSDGVCRTTDELDAMMPLNKRQISDSAGSLIMRGYAERVEVGCYQITEEGRAAIRKGVLIKSGPYRSDRGKCRAPQRNTLRQRAWNVMRMGGTFTISDLAMAAADGGEKAVECNLRKYIAALVKAGYIVEMPIRAASTKLTSNGFKRFRLLKDTGSQAPVWRPRQKNIFDYNLGDAGEAVSCQ